MRPSPNRTVIVFVAAVVLVLPLGASAALRSTHRASGPPSTMFKTGYNLCKRASLAAIDKAAGKTYEKGTFDGKFCTWSSSDGNYVIMLTTHPAAYVAVLNLLLSESGKNGDKAVSVRVPGASKAVLDTFPYAQTRRLRRGPVRGVLAGCRSGQHELQDHPAQLEADRLHEVGDSGVAPRVSIDACVKSTGSSSKLVIAPVAFPAFGDMILPSAGTVERPCEDENPA